MVHLPGGSPLLLPAAAGHVRLLAAGGAVRLGLHEDPGDPQFFTSLGYSFVVGFITIIVSILLLVPTAFWVRLRMPRARPVVEFITLLPFVIPPIVLVFGLISTYSHPPLPFTHTDIGSTALLICGYVVLSFPYMYRAIDTGLRAMDIQSLTEASQSLGAGWFTDPRPGHPAEPAGRAAERRVPDPGHRRRRVHHRHLPCPQRCSRSTCRGWVDIAPYQQSAVALVSFGLTWIAMGFIAILGRGSRSRIDDHRRPLGDERVRWPSWN